MLLGHHIEDAAIAQPEEQAAPETLPVIVEAGNVGVLETVEFLRAGGDREALAFAEAVIFVHQIAVDLGIEIHVTLHEKRLPASGPGAVPFGFSDGWVV